MPRAVLRIVGSLTAVSLLAALLVGGAASRPAAPVREATTEGREVAIFYYPWYGTAAKDGAWEHWQQHGHAPPFDIASNWFPARGAYSSSSARVSARPDA